MRIRLFFSLLSGILYLTPASTINPSTSIFSSSPLSDTTYTNVKNLTEPLNSKKVGFFQKIRNAVVGFILKMQLAKADKKRSPLIFVLVSIGLLIAVLALLFSSAGGGYFVGSLAGLALGLILLALVFAIFYSVKRRSKKTARKQ